MTQPVSLRSVVEEMEMLSTGLHSFLHKLNGEIVTISDDDFSLAEKEDDFSSYPDWHQEELQKARQVLFSDDYLKFPEEHAVNRYGIMERFCRAVENEKTRSTLLELIDGSGAFRRFKSAITRLGIEKSWYQFQDQALREIALEWLTDNAVTFTDDM